MEGITFNAKTNEILITDDAHTRLVHETICDMFGCNNVVFKNGVVTCINRNEIQYKLLIQRLEIVGDDKYV